MEIHKNTDRYVYALGCFILSVIYSDGEELIVFDHDIRAIHGVMMGKHSREERLKTQSFIDGRHIGSVAYDAMVDESKGADITINATIRLIQMKHEELLKRVYKIDSKYFESFKRRREQEHTMSSVKIANRFIEILNEKYDIFMTAKSLAKASKKRGAA